MAAFGHSESRRDRARDQSGLSLARPSGCVFPRCVKKMGLQPNKSPCKCFAGAFYFRLGAYNDMSGDGSSRQMPLQVLLRFGDSAQKVSKPKSESRMRPNPIIFRFQTLPSNIASLRKFRNCRGMSAALFAFQSAVFPFFGQKKFCHVYPLEFQQAHFYIEPSGVSREISVRTDHPVAGNYNGYRVVADRLPDCLRRHPFRSERPAHSRAIFP